MWYVNHFLHWSAILGENENPIDSISGVQRELLHIGIFFKEMIIFCWVKCYIVVFYDDFLNLKICGGEMDSKEFSSFRKKLNKTQRQFSQLLGTSVKAIHSYEQGWRSIPAHAERQMLFLVTRMNRKKSEPLPCWKIKKCTAEDRKRCPAWEFRAGDLCWFINGTICEGSAQDSWKEKIKMCRSCTVLTSQLLYS